MRTFGWWICLASAGVGGFSGLFWGIGGVACGALGGIVAGVLWSYWMSRLLRGPRAGLLGMAVVMGVAVGLLATIIMHVALLASEALWHWYPENHDFSFVPGEADYWVIATWIGIPCGLVAGAVMGLACGAICVSFPEEKKRVPPRA